MPISAAGTDPQNKLLIPDETKRDVRSIVPLPMAPDQQTPDAAALYGHERLSAPNRRRHTDALHML